MTFIFSEKVQKSLEQCQKLLAKSQSSDHKSRYLSYKQFEDQKDSLIRQVFVQQFWSHLKKPLSYNAFIDAIEFLEEACKKIESYLENAGYNLLKEKFFTSARIYIWAHKPYYLNDYLEATYTTAFKAFVVVENLYDAMDEEEEDGAQPSEKCSSCSSSKKPCDCHQIYKRFKDMNKFLREFNLLEGLVGDFVINIARTLIERRVLAKGKSNFSHSYHHELTDWLYYVIKRWTCDVYGLSGVAGVEKIGNQLEQHLKDVYAEVRVAHMFEIIIEYPNSEAAIQDLKKSLDQSTSSDFRLNLINSVKQALVESLLHPGVNTYDIITAYISAIKALRALDPTGLILQMVTEPVRKYLKSRDDTVRCIVTALTDEENDSELNREMIKSSEAKNGTIVMNLPDEGEKFTAENWEEWNPDPIKLSASMKSNRFSDPISILVNIYETKDLFVEEYQKLLSQRLLNKYGECNLDTELRNLELLTKRFSDCELHRCEVMLKDVQTSKRINKRIISGDVSQLKMEGFKNIDVLIVSSPFWPEKFSPMASLSDELPNIQFPPEIQSSIDTYTKAFEAIQASRTLHWRHHLGSVNLDLTVGGKKHNFTVSPLHASIIYLFKDKKSWKLSDIMSKTCLPAAILRSRLGFWQRNGLIKVSEDKYDLIE